MLRSMLIPAVLFAPHCLTAAEKVSATNFYVVNQEQISAGEDVFWKEDNYGTYTVDEGPIDPGFVGAWARVSADPAVSAAVASVFMVKKRTRSP